MKSITIQEVTLKDIEQLQKIGRKTFSETFSSNNSEKNRQISSRRIFQWKVDEWAEQRKFWILFCLIWKQYNRLFKNLFRNFTNWTKRRKALEIERIYILKEFHGKNVGQFLYEKAIEIATQKNLLYVWLGVWEENSRAISSYKKNGFIEFDKHIFRLGNYEQTDIMMKLKLN